MKKLLIYSVISLIFGSIIPLFYPILAAGEFQADYDVSYAVTPAGLTIVTQRVTLTNKQTNLYPKQYAVTIDTEKISDVIAHDDGGVILPEIKQGDGKTQIILTFNQKVVGLGQQLTFTLRFQNQDIAQHNGSIWEINVPGVSPDPDLGNYSVSLDVPASFGPNAYLSPLPGNGRRWTKEQMLRGGISAAYGAKQRFELDLAYFLENTKVTPAWSEVALPSDTAFQKVALVSLEPRPSNVWRDNDGNWLARYTLLPGTRTRVKAKILVEVSLTPRSDFAETVPDATSYTRALDFWEVNDPKVAALSRNYRSPRAIYDYVVSTLAYDNERVKQNPLRKGAVAALALPSQSICMEFTDLFIALARAAGIPTREIVGYAYTTNTVLRPLSLVADVLHSWPEYYDSDSRVWVPVDPTWGKTTGGVNYFDKLDFNHIAFVIHGLSSTYPYSAGFYREVGKSGKDVSVAFTDRTIDEIQGRLTTTIDFPKTVTAGFTATGNVTIENTSGVALDKVTVAIQASPFPFSLNRSETKLPPYAKLSYPVTLAVGSYLTSGAGQINATVNGQTQNFYFSVQPMYWLVVPVGLFSVGLLLIIWIIFVKLRVWKRQSHS